MQPCRNIILREEVSIDPRMKKLILFSQCQSIHVVTNWPEVQENFFIFHTLELTEQVSDVVGTCIFKKIFENEGTLLLKEIDPSNVFEIPCTSLSTIMNMDLVGTYICMRDDDLEVNLSELQQVSPKQLEQEEQVHSIVLMG